MSEEKKAAVIRYHKKTLLDTADRLLMQYGYDGMNMNMLAKEAGYSKATVYVYMTSKDEIVRLLSVERLKLLRKEFGVIVKNNVGAEEKLEAVASVLNEFAAEDKTYFDFICSSPAARDLSTDSGKELTALIKGALSDLSPIAPLSELKKMWFSYYGKLKTSALFEDAE